jgi:polyphosphate kinase
LPSVPHLLPRGGKYLIGSADMMERNLDRRVEAVVPVVDPEMQARLQEILEVQLADDVLAWQLGRPGTWRKVPTHSNLNAQRYFQDRALRRHRPCEVGSIPFSP